MGKIKDVAKAVKKVMTASSPNAFDMSSKTARENRVTNDFYSAKEKRAAQVSKWQRLDEYYHNQHYTRTQVQDLIAANGWNFSPPVLPDPFIQVESQIDNVIPQAEFRGRDNDKDSSKAKERQAVVDFICYNNKLKQLNTENERNLNKLGDAFWKVAFDGGIKGFGYVGDITIGNPSPAHIFPDPSAYDVDDCEYIIYAYRQHRRKARRIYGDIIDECGGSGYTSDTEVFDRDSNTNSLMDDTVQVVEYWYRDDEGDIACSIQVDFTEVRFIPKYWINTRNSGNQRFPFVKYSKIPVDQSFWGKGEIETIVDLVDAADREFIAALLTDMMQPADTIVYEENAIAGGQEISTGPNAMIKVKDNKINSVRRLGGLGSNNNALNMIEFIHKKIEETTGNSATNNGLEPTKVTTASGIAMMNERADSRKGIKKADRTSGFERLYELIDWTALEFYNTDRVVMIRGQADSQDGSFNDSVVFNSENFKVIDAAKADELMAKGVKQDKTDEEIKQIIEQNAYYYPPVDVEITVGEGINKSRAFTLQAITELVKTPITPLNKDMVKAQIDLLDLPNKQELKESIDAAIEQAQQPPELPPGAGQAGGQAMPEEEQAGGQAEPLPGQEGPAPEQLNPEELELFMQMPPEEQQAVIEESGLDPETLMAQIQQMGGQQ